MPDGRACKILQAPKHLIAASYLANNLTWWWSKRPDIVILSPAGPTGSPFVRQTFERLAEKPFVKNGKSVGPYTVPWERSLSDEGSRACAELGIDGSSDDMTVDMLRARAGSGVAREVVERLEVRRRLTGKQKTTSEEVRHLVERIAQARRAHRPGSGRGVRAMTIQQAKNREFADVIVLWPFQVAGGSERKRRLLYNAVTRARRQVLIIVQDPKNTRLQEAPFA